jgi:hypothetical protein
MTIEGGGDISFYDDTGTSQALYWDASAESLGIGTTSPAYSLDVQSSATTGIVAMFSNEANQTSKEALIWIAGQNKTNYGVMLGAVPEVDTPSVQDHAFIVKTNDSTGTDHTERFRISSDGNVGIGTDSPDGKLHVESSSSGATAGAGGDELILESSATTGLSILSGTANDGNILFGDSGNSAIGYVQYKHADNALNFGVNGGTKATIDSSGNFLVGKTSADNGATVGLEYTAADKLYVTDSASSAIVMNRLASDGNIAVFQKDGLEVGSIGIESGGFYIDGESAHSGLSFGGNSVVARDNGTRVDDTVDLGSSVHKFKDLYLSGTVNAATLNVDGGTIKLDGNYPTGSNNVALGNAALDDGSLSSNFNTAIGSNALTALTSGGNHTAVGHNALSSLTTGQVNVAVGQQALASVVSGSYNTGIGTSALTTNTASNNTAVGYQALTANTTAANNTAVGYHTLVTNTTGTANVAVGAFAGGALTTGGSNVAIGYNSLSAEDEHGGNVAVGTNVLAAQNAGATGYNTAVGHNAGLSVTTGVQNTLIGGLAGDASTGGANNTALGYSALGSETNGSRNVALGVLALSTQNTSGGGNIYNTAVGALAGTAVTTGVNNTLIGGLAGDAITTASNNTAVGYSAGSANDTGKDNVFIGHIAGSTQTTAVANTFVGTAAGGGVTTGGYNTFVGSGEIGVTGGAGEFVTTGSKNTIIGRYNGNQGGLDIRTSSNNIVLSDGDGNPRFTIDSEGNTYIGVTASSQSDGIKFFPNGSSGGAFAEFYNGDDGQALNIGRNSNGDVTKFINGTTIVGSIELGTGTAYNTSSDYRLKENVDYTWDATTRLKQLKPARFNFIADADTTVDGFLAHEVQDIVPEAISGEKDAVDSDGNPEYQGIDQSKLVPLLVKTIQELEARITALES